MARAEAGDDFLAVHNTRPVQAAPRPRAGAALRGLSVPQRPSQGSLFKRSAGSSRWQARSRSLAGARRTIASTATSPSSRCALDEALAEAGKLEPTELQRAMWAAYEALRYVVAVRGRRRLRRAPGRRRARRRWPAHGVGGRLHRRRQAGRPGPPNSAPAPTPRRDPRRQRQICSMPSCRATIASGSISFAQQSAALPHLDRYLAGEHEQVWRGSGRAWRTGPHATSMPPTRSPSLMRRCTGSSRTSGSLAERLAALGYSFVEPGAGVGLVRLGKAQGARAACAAGARQRRPDRRA